jgi:predicted membrane channel-forming protein YqfA (hemolysin III family)
MTKKRQLRFTMMSIALTMAAIVLFLLATLVESFSTYWIPMMAAGLVLLVTSWAIYFFGERSVKPTEEEPKETVMTVIGCKNCDMREERAFVQGDYIFKDMGPCKKCSGSSYIKAIYAVPIKKE